MPQTIYKPPVQASASTAGLMSATDKSKLDTLSLKTDTLLYNNSLTTNEYSNRIYPVVKDGNGKLCVVVPYTNYSLGVGFDTTFPSDLYTIAYRDGTPITYYYKSSQTLNLNLVNSTKLTNAALDTTEDSTRLYGVRLDKDGALAVNVPWTDTVYTHPTTSGNKHIPSGGSSGQWLKYSADGTAAWAGITANDVVMSSSDATTAKAAIDALNSRFITISSGSLHDIKKTGIYYLTGGVSDKPLNNGGYYSVTAYNADLIVGTYISTDGYVFSVVYINNTWVYKELALNSKMIWDYSKNVITANEEGVATLSLNGIGLDTPLICISFHASGNNFGGYYVCSVDYFPREISKGTHNAPAGTNISVSGTINALVFTISAPSLSDINYTVTVSTNGATYGR